MHQQLQRTRQYIVELLQSFDDSIELPLCETALIRGGEYCGHRFDGNGITAVWFFEESEVKVYGPDHRLLQVEQISEMAEPFESTTQHRRAA